MKFGARAITIDDMRQGIEDIVASYRLLPYDDRYRGEVSDLVHRFLSTVMPIYVHWRLRVMGMRPELAVHVDFDAFGQGYIDDQILVSVRFLSMWT